MIQIDNLSMRFGSKILFEGVSMNLNDGCRYGVTGANGSGKSTLLGILTGEVTDYEGRVRLPNVFKVGFLKQDHFEYEGERIIDSVIMGRPKLWAAIKEKADIIEADVHDAKSGMRLAELESVISEEHGYSAESEAAVILEGLGIESIKHAELMSTLSGGYKLRVLLAQCLFGNPDLLLLDEPTNHLDIISISWLEKYLSSYPGIVVAVSHDHHFLNAVVTHILDIDYEDMRLYHGNYDFSLEAKGLNKLQQEQLISRQEKKKNELDAFYKRFRAQATKARQAMSRKKQLDKMDDIVIKRSSRIAPKFRFTQERPSGKEVFDIRGLTKSFDGKTDVISALSLNVMRGERVAIIGPNGAGKTTLMKMILGELKPTAGEVRTGHEVHIGYFAQNHNEQIKPGVTVYDWLLNHSNAETTTVVRSVLGSMLFSGDEAKKKSEALSGGEAARLVFSRLMLARDNLLMLDEPTNHLDIESIEALAGSLLDYPGTLLFVSHDRFFVEIVATSILEITPTGFEYYNGSYPEFLAAREGRSDHLDRGNVKKERTKKTAEKTKEKPRDIRALNKELSRATAKSERIEKTIKAAEDKVEEINSNLATGELYTKGREEDLELALAELKQSEERIASEMGKWEKAHKRISELTEMVG